ncbi:MAG: cysteine synthase CysM [Bacteroidetes bacterium]|jgi:cysteine synthase B|nr:cysteine synthase CysM [Bacteroidota bacterium]
MELKDLIGNTPIVKLQHASENPDVKVFGKMEGNNPAGSVKDRPALNMIQQALHSGQINRGDTLIEATSGNTGIALAMCASLFDLDIVLVMPESATEERKKSMKAYGAELILTPAEKTIEYSRTYAQQLAAEKGYFLLNQFDNENNWKAHYKTTGPEIWNDTGGKITHFVSAMGTTGTIMGVSTYLKEQNPDIQIIGAQPEEGSRIPGIRRWSPELLPKIFNPTKVDHKRSVSENDARDAARELAKKEGIMSGMSAGGAYHIALNLAEEISEGLIVFIVCDRGDRYLSTELYS